MKLTIDTEELGYTYMSEKQKTVAKKIILALEGEGLSLLESFEILELTKVFISQIDIF